MKNDPREWQKDEAEGDEALSSCRRPLDDLPTPSVVMRTPRLEHLQTPSPVMG